MIQKTFSTKYLDIFQIYSDALGAVKATSSKQDRCTSILMNIFTQFSSNCEFLSSYLSDKLNIFHKPFHQKPSNIQSFNIFQLLLLLSKILTNKYNNLERTRNNSKDDTIIPMKISFALRIQSQKREMELQHLVHTHIYSWLAPWIHLVQKELHQNAPIM